MTILFITFLCAFGNFRPFLHVWLLWSDWYQLSDLWRFYYFFFSYGYSEYLVSQTYILLKAVLMWRVYANYSSGRFVTRVAPDSSMSYLPQNTPLSQLVHSHTKLLRNIYVLLFTPPLQFKCWLYSTAISFCIQQRLCTHFLKNSSSSLLLVLAREQGWAGTWSCSW